MAIYHLHCQPIGRGGGKSAVAAAAYRSTEKLIDNETGIICDYSRKEKAIYKTIIAPENVPEWIHDRQQLWNSVQEKENRKNSQFAWEYDLAIPHELKDKESEKIIDRFCKIFTSKGLVCDIAIHKPSKEGDQRNLHAHIMVTTREMTADGWGKKFRAGDNKMSDRKQWLKEIRQNWEDLCNEALQELGSKERISCKTLEAQGIDRVPTRHQGVHATAMERQGKKPDRTKEKIMIDDYAEQYSDSLVIDNVMNINFDEEEDIKKEIFKKDILEKIEKLGHSNGIKFFEDNNKQEELKAKAFATRNYIEDILKANQEDIKNTQFAHKELLNIMPPAVIPKPNALTRAFHTYQSSDGNDHDKFDDYAKHQQKLIDEWEKKNNVCKAKGNELNKELTQINEAKNFGLDSSPKAINCLLDVFYKQKNNRPNIFDKITKAAEKMLETAKIFLGYRLLKSAIAEAKTDLSGIRKQKKIAKKK